MPTHGQDIRRELFIHGVPEATLNLIDLEFYAGTGPEVNGFVGPDGKWCQGDWDYASEPDVAAWVLSHHFLRTQFMQRGTVGEYPGGGHTPVEPEVTADNPKGVPWQIRVWVPVGGRERKELVVGDLFPTKQAARDAVRSLPACFRAMSPRVHTRECPDCGDPFCY